MALTGDKHFGFDTTQRQTLDNLLAEAAAGTPATTTTAGTVKKAASVTAAAVPFADLTAAANKVNEILTALKAAGVMA